MNKLLALMGIMLLASCSPDVKYMPMANEFPNQTTDRVEVKLVGVFQDYLAYNGKRGVYVIVDKKTGKEFIGISGVGISETGSHPTGKSSTTDER